MSNYDLIIIGAGPGGYVAAIRAAQLGLKTAIIEKNASLGGTCLNVGCIPSKALLSSSEHFHFAQHRFAAHGIIAKELSVDVKTMMQRKDQVVSGLVKGISFLMKKNKVDVLNGHGKLAGPNKVTLTAADGKSSTLEAKNILLASGSVPVELPFMKFDGKHIISSDQAIALPSVPKSMIVVGAGAIGLEIGSVWSRLGAKVTVVEFLPRIAPGFDLEIAKGLQKNLEKQGLTFYLNTKVQGSHIEKGKVIVTANQDGKDVQLEGDVVLVAVGRRPYTETLGLEEAGVALTEKGRIRTNEHWQTSVPSIYAIGDVIDGPMLAHKAEDEGVAVAECLAGKAGHVNYSTIPGVIYTAPEASSVGMTEEDLQKAQIAYKAGKFNFMANGRAIAGDVAEGFVKILADAKTDRVLGTHILGHNASEMIAECATLMEFGGSSEDLGRTIHAHPTMSEAIKEAALAVEQRAIHA